MIHRADNMAMRKLTDEDLEQVVKAAKTMKTSKLLHLRYADPNLDLDAVKGGHHTVPQTLGKMQGCRNQVQELVTLCS